MGHVAGSGDLQRPIEDRYVMTQGIIRPGSPISDLHLDEGHAVDWLCKNRPEACVILYLRCP